jgi:hypothetical protein
VDNRTDIALIATRRVRLAPGRHASPGEGACVVELASLLAEEPFSDEPSCVCPVIGGFLRAWNDRAAYAERQRLRPYAARIVGSRSGARVTRERRDLCLEWVGADLRGGFLRRSLARLGMRMRIALYCGPGEALRLRSGAGGYAARVLFGRRDTEGAFILLDAMLALGTEYEPGPPATPVARPARARGRFVLPPPRPSLSPVAESVPDIDEDPDFDIDPDVDVDVDERQPDEERELVPA